MSSPNAVAIETAQNSASVDDPSVSRHVGDVEAAEAEAVDGFGKDSISSDNKESATNIAPRDDSRSTLTNSATNEQTNENCLQMEKKQNVAELHAVAVNASATPSLAGKEAPTEAQRIDLEQLPNVVASDLSDHSHSEITSPSSQEAKSPVLVKSTIVAAETAHSNDLAEPDIHGSGDSSKSDESSVTGKSVRENMETDMQKEKENCLVEVMSKDSAYHEENVAKPEAVVTTTTAESDEEKQSIYHIKWIKHNGTLMPIITQNENGPCPLLAIMNLLLLQSKIKLLAGTEVVTSNELMAHLADWIFEHVPKNISDDTRLNYEQNMHDAIAVFPKLQTGLDVNVRFTGVSEFEYTPECIVFDLLDVPLYHGWLVDPQVPDLVSAIGNRTYNQLVEKIILQKNSNKEELVAEALLAEEFLNVTASQLTYHGLSELSATIKEEEMCVLFRNNHFSTLYKHKNELFVLVTDQGFLRESNVVWETLSNIEGDGHFVDADFRTYRLPEAAAAPSLPAPSFPVNSKEQIDHDYLVALSLEQEQSEMQPGQPWSHAATISDHELALRLQEEENMNAESAQRQQSDKAAPTTTSSGSMGNSGSAGSVTKEKKESSCLLM